MSQYFMNIYNGVKTFLIGMKMTLHHFNNKKDLVATLQYPHEKWPIPDRNIGFDHKDYNLIRSRLHVDIDDCIGCLQCERACPVDCIKIDTIKPPKGSDIKFDFTSNDTEKKMLVSRFSIDMSECMYCNLCEYPCPEDCIYMVGGPNEEKHEIDYEFSKYERNGLVYEFAFPSDDEIVEVGGENYLEKRNSTVNKLEEGSLLQGIVQAELEAAKLEESNVEISNPSNIEKEEELGLTLKVFNIVPDKVARGVAKKAFQYTRRNNMAYVDMANYIEAEVKKASKESSEMAEAILTVRNFVDEAVKTSEDKVDKEDVVEVATEVDLGDFEFTIKDLSNIDDKMVRGIAKKAFMAAKREGLNSKDKLSYVFNAVESEGKMNDSIRAYFKKFQLDSISDNKAEPTLVEESSESVDLETLFEIKELNGIEDKVARGTAKKVYMAGKRKSLSTVAVVDDIKSVLDKEGLLTDDAIKLLDGVLNVK